MATNTQEFTAVFNDMTGAFKVDQDAYKAHAERAEKLSAVGVNAMSQSTDISANWARDALANFRGLTAAKSDPSEFAKSFSDFAAASAELVGSNLSAYAEVMKKAQSDAMELMMAAGKDASEDFTAASKKAQADMTNMAGQVRKQAAAK